MKTTADIYKLVIARGKTLSGPAYTQGAPVRYIKVPVNHEDGSLVLKGRILGFVGSFSGGEWFTVNLPGGIPLAIVVQATQAVIQEGNLEPDPVVLPVRDFLFTEGIKMIRVSIDRPQEEDIELTIYCEG